MLPHFADIEERIEARSRRRSAAEQLFLRLTGLQMKMDQYRLGAEFVNRIVADRGIEFLNQGSLLQSLATAYAASLAAIPDSPMKTAGIAAGNAAAAAMIAARRGDGRGRGGKQPLGGGGTGGPSTITNLAWVSSQIRTRRVGSVVAPTVAYGFLPGPRGYGFTVRTDFVEVPRATGNTAYE